MKRVLVPLDGTQTAEAALGALADFCSPEDEVVLLKVEKPERTRASGFRPGKVLSATSVGGPAGGGVAGIAGPDLPVFLESRDQTLQRQVDEAIDYLESLAHGLRAKGLAVKTEVLVDPEPDAAIVNYARHMRPAFIAMLRRTHGSLAELIFGSVASSVARADVAPVLLVPPPAA